VISLRIEKKGEKEMEGVTDSDKPRRLGPKRANYIRKVFALRNNKKEGKVDDVRKYVVRREIKKGDKTFFKSPKIQRLITEKRIRRKQLYKKLKVATFKLSKEKKAKYEKVLSQFIKERRAIHHKREEGAAEAKKEEKKVVAPVQKGKDAPKKTEAPKKEAPKQEVQKKEAPKKQEAPKKEAQKKGGK
jgi:hypothetical protein